MTEKEIIQDVRYFAACKPDMAEGFHYIDNQACLAFQYIQWKGHSVRSVTPGYWYGTDTASTPLPEPLDEIAWRSSKPIYDKTAGISYFASWEDVVATCDMMLERRKHDA